MRYTDRRHREEKKTEETRAMRYTDRKTQRKRRKQEETQRHEIH